MTRLIVVFFFIITNTLGQTNKKNLIDSIFLNKPTNKIGFKATYEQSQNQDYSSEQRRVHCFGIQYIKNLIRHGHSFETGLYYDKKAETSGRTVQPSPYQVVDYTFLGIPINYRYDSKSIYLSAGLLVDYLLKETLNWTPLNRPPTKKLNYGYNLNIGLEKSIMHKLNIFVEFRYAVVFHAKGSANQFIRPSFLNFGGGTGLNYVFGK